MKKIVILVFLCMGMMPLVYGMDYMGSPSTIEAEKESTDSVKLDPNDFRMFGRDGFVDIAKQVAHSIPLFDSLIKQSRISSDDELSHVAKDDLTFLQAYATVRLGVVNSIHTIVSPFNEDTLSEDIKKFELSLLACRTMLIAKVYTPPTQKPEVPKLFELAWSSQLYDQRVNQDRFREHLAALGMNKDLVDSIMLLAASNLSGQGATVQPENGANEDKGKTKNPLDGLQDKLRSYAVATWQMIPGENKMVTVASAATFLIALYMYFRNVK